MCACSATRNLKAAPHNKSGCSTENLKRKDSFPSGLLNGQEQSYLILFFCYCLDDALEMNTEFKNNCGSDLSFKSMM